MNKKKVFLILVLCLLAIGLICIGVGYMMGGDFSTVFADIMADIYSLIEGTAIVPPTVT